MVTRRVQRRRLLAGLLAAALAMAGAVSPSVAAAAGSTAVDDDVTAVVNAVTGYVNVLSNDVRARGGPFNAFAVVYPGSAATAAGGSVTCSFSSCSYTAPTGFLGSDSFTYRLTYPAAGGGNTGPTSLATVHVTVVANGAPTAVDDAATVRGTSQLDVTDNDTDPNRYQVGERLTVLPTAPFATAAGATVTCPSPGSQQACDYAPASGFAGTDSFEYTVVDLNGATDVGTVTVNVPPNQPPAASDDAFHPWVRYGATPLPIQLDVLANDSDPDGDSILPRADSATTTAGGAVTCTWTCAYQPPDRFFGIDTFTYVAVDGLGGTSTPATVTVTVASDEPPAAVDDVAATKGTRTVQVPVLDNDSDDHGNSSLVDSWTVGGSDATSANGGVVACMDSACGYTAAAGFVGVDTFRYVISDGVSTASGEVTVTVGANTAPVANDDARLFRVDDGEANDGDYHVRIPVLTNDTDADGDALVAEGAGVTAAGHDWWCGDGSCTLQVPEGWIGVDVFTYSAIDGFGGSDTAQVTVDADTVHTGGPDVQPDAATTSTNTPVTVGVLANDQFWDPVDPTLTVDPGTFASAAGGSVTCSTADCTYTPPTGFTGTDTFTYRAVTRYLNGGHGTVTVEIVPGVNGTTTDGGTFSSGAAPSAVDPLTTSVVTPVGGAVRIVERATQTTPPVGYGLFGQEVSLTALDQTAAAPLQVTFQLDASLLGGTAASAVQVWRNGALVPNCVGGSAATQANPDPCVKQRAALAGGGARVTVLSSAASVWGFGRMTAVAPGAPMGVTATAGVRSVTASWAPPGADGGAPVSGYQVTATPVSVPAGVIAVARTVTVSGSPAATTATVGSLVNGVTYEVTVRARNAVNTAFGPYSAPSPSVTTPTVPAAPTAVSVAAGVRSVSASWSPPADDGGAPITAYRVTATPVAATVPMGVTASTRTVTVTGAPPAPSATVTSLLNGVSYTVTVTARNAAVATYSAASDPVTADVPGLPEAPSVSATPGPTSATIFWTAPSSDLPVTRYTVRATAPRAGTTPHVVTRTLNGAPPDTSTTLTGLIAGLDYTVTVTATSAVGTGPASVPSDPVRPLLGISVNDVTRAEGNTATTSFTFTVRLSAAQATPVTVDVTTAEGTAGGPDYTSLVTTVTFAPGQTSRSVTVRVNGDATPEPDETFTVNLSNPSTGGFTKQTGTGTIINDDT